MASAPPQVRASSLPSIFIKTPSKDSNDQDAYTSSFLLPSIPETKTRPRSFSIASPRHPIDLQRYQRSPTHNSTSISSHRDLGPIMNSEKSSLSKPRPITAHSHDGTCPRLPINLRNDTDLLKKYHLVPPSLCIPFGELETQLNAPKPKTKDPTQLVYNITTSKFRRARRSTLFPDSAPSSPRSPSPTRPPGANRLIKKRRPAFVPQAAEPSFMNIDIYMPPLLVDGRRSVIVFPRKARTIEIYWRHGLNIRTPKVGTGEVEKKQRGHPGETTVQLRRVKLPSKIWFERNVLGWWEELWIERV
ncbi:hypothetical protein BJ875DRAFT_455359 [Amylocarpus encephaloides]|uniref:Uncharacterized protein n=1 Tax=Amylocarpus encephaloides TaxID=45428 RepID=A0A9P7YPI2_9HELO|nr:hypothetical protein BJ875DRAFT_455359 [Amylocarpus encephaloides]